MRPSRHVLLPIFTALSLAGAWAPCPGSAAQPEPGSTGISASSTFMVPVYLQSGGDGAFVTALARGHGITWVATEGDGVWSFRDRPTILWTHFPEYGDPGVTNGLRNQGETSAYALAVDSLGRAWVGGLSRGCSVWNGTWWRTYDRQTGPLGGRVFAIAAGPAGDVWIGSDEGLSHYSDAGGWTYYTVADGLPSNQVSALAITPGGIVVGTECDGIAVGSAEDGYRHWRLIPGPLTRPGVSAGRGLPSACINCLAADRQLVLAGTPSGLGVSRDGGMSWNFLRGTDWMSTPAVVAPKANGGVSNAASSPSKGAPEPVLLEDYVTAVVVDQAAEHVIVGHRQHGYEVLDPSTWRRIFPLPGAHPGGRYVSAILPPGPAGPLLIGYYGDGIESVGSATSGRGDLADTLPGDNSAPFPRRAAPPAIEQLNRMAERVRSAPDLPAGTWAQAEGPDYSTEGNWVGRYGRDYAILFAASGLADQEISWSREYTVEASIGPNHAPGDAVRRYRARIVPPASGRYPYSPASHYRINSSCDDHGETLPMTVDGPSLFFRVKVPGKVHTVSVYLLNPDGHIGPNRYRDYLVEVYPNVESPAELQGMRPLAHERVSSFWSGVWARFVVCGGRSYWVKVGRNHSFNTICQAIAIDTPGPTPAHATPLPFLNGWPYGPPLAPKIRLTATASGRQLAAAVDLWKALDLAWGRRGMAGLQAPYRTLAYRAAWAAGAPAGLLDNWRWELRDWRRWDDDLFEAVMSQAATGQRPGLQAILKHPARSPNIVMTIPLSRLQAIILKHRAPQQQGAPSAGKSGPRFVQPMPLPSGTRLPH